MKDKNIIIGGRLLKCAGYIRRGAVLCDVGTDHAKLPIYLSQKGFIERAYATDVNYGPIQTAESNVALFGYSDVIKCIHTDGLKNTEGLGVTDVSICGMGGELIARILSECQYIKDDDINLVLQPMTHSSDLRAYLYENGFDITDESLTVENDKLYTIICARYSGIPQPYTDIDLLLGKILPSRVHDELFCQNCERQLHHLRMRQKSQDDEERKQARELAEQIIGILNSQ